MYLNFFADTNMPEVVITAIRLKLADGTEVAVGLYDTSIIHRHKGYGLDAKDVRFLDQDLQPNPVGYPEELIGAQVTGIHTDAKTGADFFFGITELSFEENRNLAYKLPDRGKYLYQAGEDKVLSYGDFIALGQKHYSKGGDVIAECWDRKAFDLYTQEYGDITESEALGMCELYFSDEEEQEAMQGW